MVRWERFFWLSQTLTRVDALRFVPFFWFMFHQSTIQIVYSVVCPRFALRRFGSPAGNG